MLIKESKGSICNLALALLCIINILELFVPRSGEGSSMIRMPIYLVNGALLSLMWFSLLVNSKHWNATTKTTYSFIVVILIYSFIQAVSGGLQLSQFSPYIKLLVWTTAIIFFYESLLVHGLRTFWMRLYILTFIASIIKRMLESAIYESEVLGGGDTSSLPLLFIIPLILLFFSKSYKYLIVGLVFFLIMLSLRRTAIIGLLFCIPFIYKYLKSELKSRYILIASLLFVAVFAYAWHYIGDAIAYRFESLLLGDNGGEKDSFGSGRSDFYLIVWDAYWNGELFHILFGNGVTSVNNLLTKKVGIEHAHNDLLEIGYTFGVAGVAIWLLFMKSLWRLKSKIRQFYPSYINIFYITFFSYLIIAFASGAVLRVTTLPFALTIAVLLSGIEQARKTEAPPHYLLPELMDG